MNRSIEGLRSRRHGDATSAIRRARALAMAALIAVAALIPVTSVAADESDDMVLRWNDNALAVLSQPPTNTPPGLGQGPPPAALHIAMVHGAIYDAVNAIAGGHEPYLAGVSAGGGESQAAAVAQAGHDVLMGLTPATNTAVRDRIAGMLAASLADIDEGAAKDNGRAVGAEAAAAMLQARSNDGRSHVEPFPTSDDLGKWQVVPPASNNVAGQFATVTPLTMKSPDQFRTEGPLDITSPEYAAEFNEVKALGGQSGSSRTAEQTSLAGFVGANPLLFFSKGLRDMPAVQGLSTADQALLFVKTSMAGADGLIGCWNDKLHYLVWRPQTAIIRAAEDGNPLTSPDPDWLSLFATPGYPDHPSGYNCYAGGFWHSVRLFFGTDKVSFSLTSPGVAANAAAGNPVGVPGSTRDYKRFTDVIDDTIDGRIYTGFHFRTPDVQGAWLGKKVAQYLDKHYFAPVD